jgi:putative ABC transport system substrate-binding protein
MIKLVLVAVSLLLLPVGARSTVASPVIIVMKSRALPQYTSALESFKKTLSAHGISASYFYYDLEGSKEEGVRIIDSIRRLKPALILSIGTLATETAKEQITTTPIVFNMVLNPVDTNLVRSMVSSGNNLTGAALDIPVRSQFQSLQTILPRIKKMGVIYNPQETVAIIAEASKTAREMGIELIAVPVTRSNDIPRALEEIKAFKVDCLWAVSDSTVFNSLKSVQFIIMFSIHNRLPFIGLSSSFVKFGALLALTADSESNGTQSGEIALHILKGEKPASIPIGTSQKISLSINTRVAAQIGIVFPPETVAMAKEVYK